MRRFLVGFALLLGACMEVDNPFVDDDGGLGGGSSASGGGTASAGGGSASAGGGTASVGGGTSSSGGGTTSTGGSSASGGGSTTCVEDWSCSDWLMTDGGTAVRTCVDGMGCGTSVSKPSEGPSPVPALDTNYFRCDVQPVLDATCSMIGCHGKDVGRDLRVYARGRFRNNQIVPDVPTCLTPGQPKNLQMEGTGTIMCLGWSRLTPDEWRKNYDSARLFAVGLTDTAQSQLLQQPLNGSGYAHDGIKVFSMGDARYTAVKAWLDGATAPANCDGGMN